MTANTPASRKAKGRRLQQAVRQDLVDRLGIDPGDVQSTAMGQSGCDLYLSPADRERFLVAKEVYDLCDDIHRARWRKVHALAVRLVGTGPIEALPDNLLAAERDYLNSVIRIREIREQGQK